MINDAPSTPRLTERASQRARRGMLVHEEARAFHRTRAVELPELAKGRRLARGSGVILERLRVRANRSPVDVHDAHGIGNDVEDRLELRDAPPQCLTELLAFADVGPGEEDRAAAGLIADRGEGRLDQARPGPKVEGHPLRGPPGDAAHRGVDLFGKVGQGVGEGVVDR
jgi:hypothetical protein